MKIKHTILWARRIFLPAGPRLVHGPTVGAMGILGVALSLGLGSAARAQTILGSTADYGVMAGSTVTINGITTITGNLGGANIAGAGTLTLNGTQGAITTQNQDDFTKAFNGLAAMTPTLNLSGQTLGDGGSVITLTPGIYKFDSTAQLTGTLTLNAQGLSNAVWVFQIGTALTTADHASVVFANLAANSAATNGLFWQVGSATVFGAGTSFEGNVLGGTTFSFGSGATIDSGRALTGAGQTVTLNSNTIKFIAANSGYSGGLMFNGGGNLVAVPEPAATSVLIAGILGLVVGFRRLRRNAG